MSKKLTNKGKNDYIKDACDIPAICNRLHRISGQVNAVEKMIHDKRDYVEILQQVMAARQAMDKVAVLVLESEAQGCLNKESKQASKDLARIASTLFKAV